MEVAQNFAFFVAFDERIPNMMQKVSEIAQFLS